MANISGTNVAAPVRPFSDEDKFPVAFANEIKGGAHTVDTVADMYAIPKDRRDKGMICSIKGTGKTYKLINNPDTNETTADDWAIFGDIGSVSEMKLADGKTTLAQKLANIDKVLNNKYAVFELDQANDVGPSDIEMVAPFTSTTALISASIPIKTNVTKNIQVAVEIYNEDTGSWDEIGVVNIPKNEHIGHLSLETPFEIPSGSRIRCNILKTLTSVETIEVMIYMKLK